jgi:hypothetical protein
LPKYTPIGYIASLYPYRHHSAVQKRRFETDEIQDFIKKSREGIHALWFTGSLPQKQNHATEDTKPAIEDECRRNAKKA